MFSVSQKTRHSRVGCEPLAVPRYCYGQNILLDCLKISGTCQIEMSKKKKKKKTLFVLIFSEKYYLPIYFKILNCIFPTLFYLFRFFLLNAVQLLVKAQVLYYLMGYNAQEMKKP